MRSQEAVVHQVAFLTVEEAIRRIPDGATVAAQGFGIIDATDVFCAEIERQFLAQGHPRALTFVHASGLSDKVQGVERLVHPGLLRRVIGSHWGWAPRTARLIAENGCEAFCLPQGQMARLYQAIAAGNPGLLTPIGLHTFVDPRVEGGKLNECTQSLCNMVDLVRVDGKEYLLYRAFPIDVALIRGTRADAGGNISQVGAALKLETLSMAQAARASGGMVLALVDQVLAEGAIPPYDVAVPGLLVDAVVERTPQVGATVQAPSEVARADALAGLRGIIGRRAAQELYTGAIVNLGTGIPADTLPAAAAEQGLVNAIVLTVESGVIGGLPRGGVDFGLADQPQAIIPQTSQFDFYNGGGLDMTFMGMAEVGATGDVNVSRFGGRVIGCGGFIDITQATRKVVFCGAFADDGLVVEANDGRLQILHEGRLRKFVKDVAQVTFSSRFAHAQGTDVLYITERAVFRLVENGLVLCEVAPGVDVEREILSRMDARPAVGDLKLMDAALFGGNRTNTRNELPQPVLCA
jgi:propionate CoA-transferase